MTTIATVNPADVLRRARQLHVNMLPDGAGIPDAVAPDALDEMLRCIAREVLPLLAEHYGQPGDARLLRAIPAETYIPVDLKWATMPIYGIAYLEDRGNHDVGEVLYSWRTIIRELDRGDQVGAALEVDNLLRHAGHAVAH